jgi:pimeloyl-ACP methyl ester carboxylesterase
MIDDPRGRIDYDESGAGPTIVFLPGSCSTGAAWRPVIANLGGRFRSVTTSLPGYGGTAERRTAGDPPLAHEVAVVEQVMRRAAGLTGGPPRDEPLHLVGHSFGGLVGLAVALRGLLPVASLTVLEAPLPNLLQACGELAAYAAFRQMTDHYFAAFERGEREAIAGMIDFYGGAGTWASWPPRVRDYAVRTTSVNILDWLTGYGLALPPAVLQGLRVPTQIVCGGLSHPAVRRGNELLSIHIPDASYTAIKDAAHFMISTHPDDVAPLVARHVTEQMGNTLEQL